ncbi:mutator type transposase [Tanacetum coccineum]
MKVKGNFSEQYSLLMDYVLELQRTNEDTTMKIDLEKDYNLKGLRDLLGLDGCFIKGQYAGQLLTSVGIDANHGIYLVAYAIVETKNTSSWSWSLTCLWDDLDLNPMSNFTFKSDRQKCILPAIAQVFPNAEYRFCVRHIYENFKAQQKGRAHCDVLLNWLCEVFNRQLLDGRDVPIITCLEFVRDYLMKRIVNVKKVISKSPGPLTPSAIKLFEAIKYKATFYKVVVESIVSVIFSIIHVTTRNSLLKQNLGRGSICLTMKSLQLAIPVHQVANFQIATELETRYPAATIAIKNRFGGNAATKKTQKNLLKQQYENFVASSTEVIEQTYERLQKLIS